MFGKRILLAVPHPDDEVVACTGALLRAQAEGASIFAIYLTHGCIDQKTRWPWERPRHDKFVARRRHEAEQAAKLLGIMPVGWSRRPARFLWRELSSVYQELGAAIALHKIDQLWVPAYEGGNADHDGLNAVASLFSSSLSVLEFAEYNFFEGRAHSQSFPYPTGAEMRITLTEAERTTKETALRVYASERGNLNYVKTQTECWRPLQTYDYCQPPHGGTLWYARFQWVPFRHPRVDFTKAADVSAAITTFLGRTKPSRGTGFSAN